MGVAYCKLKVESLAQQQCLPLKVMDALLVRPFQVLADSLAHCHTHSPEYSAKSMKKASEARIQASGSTEANILPLFSHH